MITFQLDSASPIVSVLYRFLIASSILYIACKILKVPLKFRRQDHLWFFGQGICMFSINYILTYIAEGMVSSGLVAVTNTLILYYNIMGTWLWFKTPLRRNVILGSTVGACGIALIFLQEIQHFDSGSKTIFGLAIAAIAAVFASGGNLISYVHRRREVSVMASNTYGMFYGSCVTLGIAVLYQTDFTTHWNFSYVASLLYLAVFGSVVAFGAYLSLASRIGAEKAAYTNLISPIIALILSSFFENFRWTWQIALGIGICLLGNYITLYKPKKRATL